MKWLFLAIGIIVLIILIKLHLNALFLAKRFRLGNAIVYGKKRKGKDLIFQKVIRTRKEAYFSNIEYGFNRINFNGLKDVSVAPNTYNDMINNTVKKIPRNDDMEKTDIYISDGGIHLPSQYQHLLVRQYASMPLFYSLSGHLYANNVHVNYNGSFSRLWDKLREQADEYFRALNTIKLGPWLFTKIRYFEEQQACEKNVLPFKKAFFSLRGNPEYRVFVAENGLVRDFWIVSFIPTLKYDTRYFKGVFFGLVD